MDTVRNTLSGATALLVADLPFVIVFLGLIFVIAGPIVWVLMIILPVFMFMAWRSGNVMSEASHDERESSMRRDGLVAEMINGRTAIKALGLQEAMRPAWEERHANNIERSIIRGTRTDFYSNLGAVLTLVTSVMLTSIGALAIIDQKMTMGSLIAANMLTGRVLGPLNQLVAQWRAYSSFKESVARLGETFDSPEERMLTEVEMNRPKGKLDVEDVVFSYGPGLPPTLDNVSLVLEAGGVHALIGRNGSGKTTLLKMLLGLYMPSNGRILLDGADIAQFSRPQLSRWIGYVPQESILFAGSVRDNIAHRMPDAEDDEIVKAATAAGVHHFIIDMPDGYGTDIGEAGRSLSGGQRQRIAIARALIGDPPVVLMDEPTSSLDRQAEHDVRDTLIEIGKERTVIIVTHSPSLLASCDDLVALDKGRVALAGPAHEILPRLFGGAVPVTNGGKDKKPAGKRPPQPAAAAAEAPRAKSRPPAPPAARPSAPPQARPRPAQQPQAPAASRPAAKAPPARLKPTTIPGKPKPAAAEAKPQATAQVRPVQAKPQPEAKPKAFAKITPKKVPASEAIPGTPPPAALKTTAAAPARTAAKIRPAAPSQPKPKALARVTPKKIPASEAIPGTPPPPVVRPQPATDEGVMKQATVTFNKAPAQKPAAKAVIRPVPAPDPAKQESAVVHRLHPAGGRKQGSA